MRRFLFMATALLVPVLSHGQQSTAPTKPNAPDPITRSFRGCSYYGGWLLAAFASIPAASHDFRPTPVQQSVGYIAQHLESADYALCSRFSGLRPPVWRGEHSRTR